MNILVLNGSPRPRGNTKRMIEAFREGRKRAGIQLRSSMSAKNRSAAARAVDTATQRDTDNASRRTICGRSMIG